MLFTLEITATYMHFELLPDVLQADKEQYTLY